MDETPRYSRRVVIVFVDDFSPSTVAALRYARSLRPSTSRAVHVVIDSEQAQRLRAAWPPDHSVPLEVVDCPDRRLTRCVADLAPGAKRRGDRHSAVESRARAARSGRLRRARDGRASSTQSPVAGTPAVPRSGAALSPLTGQ